MKDALCLESYNNLLKTVPGYDDFEMIPTSIPSP
jgi:hypothetical protein